jgi:hypothetical protein
MAAGAGSDAHERAQTGFMLKAARCGWQKAERVFFLHRQAGLEMENL